MSIVSYGYAAAAGGIGTIDTAQWAKLAGHLGVDYSVAPYGADAQVAPLQASVGAGDRTVVFGRGVAFGRGVMDVVDDAITVSLDAAAAGAPRWYVIGIRRDWEAVPTGGTDPTGASSLVVLGYSTISDETAAIAAVIAARYQLPGITKDEQPIAAALVVNGESAVQAIRDLRCWAGPGGLAARHTHALAYLGRVGARVSINGAEYRMDFNGSNPEWRSSTNAANVTLLGKGAPIVGGTTVPGSGVFIQAGTTVKTSDSNGLAAVDLPVAFPTALLAVVCWNGDANIDSQTGDQLAMSRWGAATLSRFTYAVEKTRYTMQAFQTVRVPNLQHRIDWIAIGY